MSREYPAHPLPGVLAIIARAGRVLLVQRGREPNKGVWGFPGGLVETGETLAEAALRELREETGIVAEAGPVVDVLESITRDAHGMARYHFVLAAVSCRWVAGEGQAADDAAAIGWFSQEDLVTLDRVPDLDRLAAAALGRMATGD